MKRRQQCLLHESHLAVSAKGIIIAKMTPLEARVPYFEKQEPKVLNGKDQPTEPVLEPRFPKGQYGLLSTVPSAMVWMQVECVPKVSCVKFNPHCEV